MTDTNMQPPPHVLYFSSSDKGSATGFLSTVHWEVPDLWACLPMLLCPSVPSLLQPTSAPNSGPDVGAEGGAGRTVIPLYYATM